MARSVRNWCEMKMRAFAQYFAYSEAIHQTASVRPFFWPDFCS